MLLKGSCHCGKVQFTVESHTPYPYMRCYCSICRKTAGAGGYAINIMGEAKTLKVTGKQNLGVYRARIEDPERPGKIRVSSARRHFCKRCGSPLWIWDPRWGKWVYPFASAIDTPLPKPPERQHIFVGSAAAWASVPRGPRDRRYWGYSEEAIIDWHRRRGLYVR